MFVTIVKFLGLSVLASFMLACASQPQTGASDLAKKDPYEKVNRAVFGFNMGLDRWVLKPVAKGYNFVTPKVVQKGVGNFFGNLGEVSNIANDVMQWKWKQAANDTGRLLVNTTVGIGGIFDVAAPLGMERSDGEDFGQTLAKWGVKQGPYFVLPIWGPVTVRSGLGLPLDSYVLDPLTYVENRAVSNSLSALRLVQKRVDLFPVEELASGDFYIFVRDTYLQRRDYLIRDGEVGLDYEDDFGEEDF